MKTFDSQIAEIRAGADAAHVDPAVSAAVQTAETEMIAANDENARAVEVLERAKDAASRAAVQAAEADAEEVAAGLAALSDAGAAARAKQASRAADSARSAADSAQRAADLAARVAKASQARAELAAQRLAPATQAHQLATYTASVVACELAIADAVEGIRAGLRAPMRQVADGFRQLEATFGAGSPAVANLLDRDPAKLFASLAQLAVFEEEPAPEAAAVSPPRTAGSGHVGRRFRLDGHQRQRGAVRPTDPVMHPPEPQRDQGDGLAAFDGVSVPAATSTGGGSSHAR